MCGKMKLCIFSKFLNLYNIVNKKQRVQLQKYKDNKLQIQHQFLQDSPKF